MWDKKDAGTLKVTGESKCIEIRVILRKKKPLLNVASSSFLSLYQKIGMFGYVFFITIRKRIYLHFKVTGAFIRLFCEIESYDILLCI